MTCFMLYDEAAREFEPLDEEPARHASAIAMYCLVGQACAQRTTDGLVSRKIIRATLMTWPKEMVAIAIADLIALGLWCESGDGFQYVDWDLRQFTRERELARRQRNAEKQRRARQRERDRKQDNSVTGNVTGYDPGNVTAATPIPHQREREKGTCKVGDLGNLEAIHARAGAWGPDVLDEQDHPTLKAVRK